MNKLTISIPSLLAMTLTGCKGNKPQQQIDAEIANHITKFNYGEHKYLLYKRYYGKGGIGSIAHDPDCPCHNKQ